jgi:hypothetical protein
MKRYFLPIGICVFLLLCLVPNGEAQASPCVQDPLGAAPTWQVGLKCTFTSASTPVPFTATGIQYWIVAFVPSGTVSGATLSLDSSISGSSWTTGGIIPAATIGAMTSSGSYGPNATGTTPSLFGRLNPTITGSGTVVVTLHGYIVNPATVSTGCIATASTLSASCGTTAGEFASITDGSTATDCTVGGGSNKNLCIYNGSAWVFAGSSSSVGGQVNGQPSIGGSSAGSVNTSPGTLFVSAPGFCGASLTCPNETDASFGIQAAIAQLQNGGASAATGHIAYDMCGTQTWSEQPFSGFAGLFESEANCSIANTSVISLDGISSLTMPSSMQWKGDGLNGFAQVPSGTYVRACNPIINNCAHGGFVVQNSSATTITTSVTGSVMTITLAAGAPFDVTSTHVNNVQAGRQLCIAGSSTTNNNGCWTWNATTSGAAPQVFKVNVVSGVTSSCASSCGTVYLDTPIVVIGTGGGGGVYGTRIDNVVFDCNYVIGCGGPVNGQGEELTGFGEIQVYNAFSYYWRIDQSPAYGGQTAGATNSGPYGPLAGNVAPVVCSKTGGCACIANTGSGINPATSVSNVCTGGIVGVGALMTCGAGQNTGTVPAVISPDACDNPNFVGSLMTGLSGNQGFGPVAHLTVSISDKSVGGGSPIPGLRGGTTGADPGSSAATTGVGFGVYGVHVGPIGDTHPEYFNIGGAACGNSAIAATWQEEYGSILTSGVLFDGGFWAFNSGGEGFDFGQSGASSTCQEIYLRSLNIGTGTGTVFSDNINSNTCSDQVFSYHLGNATNPVLENSCATGNGPQLAKAKVGTVNVTTGYQINGSAAATTVNGLSCTLGSSCTIPLSANNPQTATYQVLAADFSNYKTITVASGTFTITLVASGSQPAAGQSIHVINYGSGTVTIAVSGQNINGAATSISLPPPTTAQQPVSAVVESDGTNYFADVSGANAASLGGKTFAIPNPIGLTTPNSGAFTSLAAGSAKWNVNTGGLPTQSNNVTLAGQGYPLIVGVTSQKSETGTADASVLAVTPASAVGTYQACVSISVSSGTSGVIGWTLSWTDSNGNAQSSVAQSLFQGGTAAPALTFTTSAAGNYSSCTSFDVNSAGAAITVKWVGGGTTAAKMTAYVTRII